MRKAGINPIVAMGAGGSGMSGAGVPSGAAGSVGVGGQGNPLAGLQEGVSAYKAASEKMKIKQEAVTSGKQADLLGAQKEKTDAETAAITAGIPKRELIGDVYRTVTSARDAVIRPYVDPEGWAAEAMKEKAIRLGPDFAGATRRGAHKRHRSKIEAKRNYK